LVAEAWDVGIDFERAIYELSLRERFISKLDQQIRENAGVARAAVTLAIQHSMTQEQINSARRSTEDLEWLSGVNQPVIAEYQDCRRELEKIRDTRLQKYATQWEQYLSALDSPVAQEVRTIWSHLQSHLWAPEAAPTEEGGFRMVWDRGPHHLQVEALADGRYDWFYRNRESGVKQFEEDLQVGTFSSSFAEILARLAAA